MKKSVAPIVTLGLVWLVSASGCGGGGGDLFGGNSTAGSTTGTVTDNPRAIVPWSDVQGKTDVAATMRVNDQGTTVTQIPAEIFSAQIETVTLSGRTEPNVEDLYCQPGNNRPVYEGDSGSPVLIGGKIVGGLYGTSDNQTFGARGIQQEIATASGPVKTKPARKTPQRFFEGPANLFPRLQSRPGFQNIRYNGPRAGSDSRAPGGSSVPPLPGRRFASPFVLGPYVAGYDAATYTIQLVNGNWVGTAHGLEDAGTVQWPITSFYVDGFADGSVKGHIIGGVYGTLIYDGQNGSLINPSAPAPMMVVNVVTTVNNIPIPAVTHRVRYDLGSDTENQGIEISAQATIDAQLKNSNGPFTVTGSITITAGGVSTTHTLSFPANVTADALETSLGDQIDNILLAQHAAAPSQQITTVLVSLHVSD